MERIGWGFLQAFALHLVLTTSVIYCSCSRVSELRTMSVSRCVYLIWWMLLLFQFYFYLGTLLPGILTDTWTVTRYVQYLIFPRFLFEKLRGWRELLQVVAADPFERPFQEEAWLFDGQTQGRWTFLLALKKVNLYPQNLTAKFHKISLKIYPLKDPPDRRPFHDFQG